MKALRLLGLALCVATAWAAPTAASLVSGAEAKAAEQHKNVLVVFHASWCHWCHKFDDMLNNPTLKESFDKSYVIVHITVLEDDAHKADENPGGQDLLASLGGKDGGIPFFVIFNKDNKNLGDSNAPTNIGFPSEPKEVAHFMKLMKKTSHMDADELVKLEAFLEKKS